MTTLTRHSLDHRLQALRDDLVRLSCLLDLAIQKSTQALVTQDINLAHQVIADDMQVNTLRYQVEDACLAIIATQQPTAHDLRLIMSIFSMVADLERMADHAAGIATIVVRMGDEPPLKPLIDIPRMAEACRAMLRDALNAYLANNTTMAREVIESDDRVDDLYQQVFRELLTFMLEDPRTLSRALHMLFVAHNLERIGDRAVNLAERSLFAVNGEVKNTLQTQPSLHA